jgi:hypothetical protein
LYSGATVSIYVNSINSANEPKRLNVPVLADDIKRYLYAQKASIRPIIYREPARTRIIPSKIVNKGGVFQRSQCTPLVSVVVCEAGLVEGVESPAASRVHRRLSQLAQEQVWVCSGEEGEAVG